MLLTQENRQSLVIVKLDEIDESKLSKELRYIIQSLTYLSWSDDLLGDDSEFWNKLKLTVLKENMSYTNTSLVSDK